MPGIARKSGTDTVNTVHVSVGDAAGGDGSICDAAPQTIVTSQGSNNVFVNNIGAVRKTDLEQAHTIPPVCATHATGLATHSPNVFVNNLEVGRLGDSYNCGATITSSSTNVFANGK